ncbi:MAG TPA: hypothetical protein DCZ95_17470 [Verrucomicrobia bacterium]|nr:MAG: hypothetical protein A2X46_17540 [Lentisphaerae bacterium GWF2_57_35]HBA85876.1 hypothetical protein [Verrucomicrobiota bacterium]
MMGSTLGAFAIAISAQANLLNPTAAAWLGYMDHTTDWETWNTAFQSNSNDASRLYETSEDNWGSAWTHVGEADVSVFRYLSIDVTQISGQTIVALAGPNSSAYEEMMVIQNPGQRIVDISNWLGNGPGAEELYVLLIPVGENAFVSFKEIRLGRMTDWKANMNDASQWDNYNTTVRAAGYSTLTQSNDVSAASWGKSWTYAGQVDVSSCKKLSVTIPALAGTAKVALSGPNDANYTEYLTITEPGEYSTIVTNWEGNTEGSEDVYLQLVAEGQSAEVYYSKVSIGADAIWLQDMQNVLEWNSWQSTLWANGQGTATLTESGPSSWGKSWINAGTQDLSVSGKLHVQIPRIAGGSVAVALSGPNDANYQEFLSISEPGEYLVDVSSWAGNGGIVFVQLLVIGEGASAAFDSISFEK